MKKRGVIREPNNAHDGFEDVCGGGVSRKYRIDQTLFAWDEFAHTAIVAYENIEQLRCAPNRFSSDFLAPLVIQFIRRVRQNLADPQQDHRDRMRSVASRNRVRLC